MRMRIHVYGFLRNNRHKGLTIQVWMYTALYRFLIRFVPMKYMEAHMGEKGEETSLEADSADYRYAQLVSRCVQKSASRTPWESKCLVMALTARRILSKRNYPTTLYMGVKREGDGMIAHAWLRFGAMYVTGGDGTGYCIVARYRR